MTPKPDADELLGMLQDIESDPDGWEQEDWRTETFCGTAYCAAGRVGVRNGVQWVNGPTAFRNHLIHVTPEVESVVRGAGIEHLIATDPPNTRMVPIAAYAAAKLGIGGGDDGMGGASIPLFEGGNSLYDLRRIVKTILVESGQADRWAEHEAWMIKNRGRLFAAAEQAGITAEAVEAALHCEAKGDGDMLVVLRPGTDVPGAQHDDGVTAVSAGDLLAYLRSKS